MTHLDAQVAHRQIVHSANSIRQVVLALALFGSTIAPIRAAPPVAEKLDTSGVYETLRDRIRTASILKPEDPGFPEVLIVGSRYGGEVFVSTIVHDPLNPETLSIYFDAWNLTARANLLLQYAQSRTASTRPKPLPGVSDETKRNLQAHASEMVRQRARIGQLVHAGGYASEWDPFVAAYGKFIAATEKAIPSGDTSDDRTLSDSKTVSRVAREEGLYKLLREIRIEPDDVANEVLRSLSVARKQMGADGAVDQSTYLFYTCERAPSSAEATASGASSEPRSPRKKTVNINVHTWNKLAPAFFHALEAAGKGSRDPDASLITASYLGLAEEINSWVASHPEADTSARDRELNRMAVRRSLVSMLEHFADTSERTDDSSRDGDSQVPKTDPKKKEDVP